MQAFLVEHDDGGIEFVGSRTEGALLILLKNWGYNYKMTREKRASDVAKMYGFSSEKKMASVVLRTKTGYCLYNKVCDCDDKLTSDMHPYLYHAALVSAARRAAGFYM